MTAATLPSCLSFLFRLSVLSVLFLSSPFTFLSPLYLFSSSSLPPIFFNITSPLNPFSLSPSFIPLTLFSPLLSLPLSLSFILLFSLFFLSFLFFFHSSLFLSFSSFFFISLLHSFFYSPFFPLLPFSPLISLFLL